MVEYILKMIIMKVEVRTMQIETKTMVSISEANQNFSRVARIVDQFGSATILKNNAPRYFIVEFQQAEKLRGEPAADPA